MADGRRVNDEIALARMTGQQIRPDVDNLAQQIHILGRRTVGIQQALVDEGTPQLDKAWTNVAKALIEVLPLLDNVHFSVVSTAEIPAVQAAEAVEE